MHRNSLRAVKSRDFTVPARERPRSLRVSNKEYPSTSLSQRTSEDRVAVPARHPLRQGQPPDVDSAAQQRFRQWVHDVATNPPLFSVLCRTGKLLQTILAESNPLGFDQICRNVSCVRSSAVAALPRKIRKKLEHWQSERGKHAQISWHQALLDLPRAYGRENVQTPDLYSLSTLEKFTGLEIFGQKMSRR